METRNWEKINCVVNTNNEKWSFKEIIEEMEEQAKKAKQEHLDLIKCSSRTSGFFLFDLANRILYSERAIETARMVSTIKEQKLNLLYRIMNTSAARVSRDVFNSIVKEELRRYTVNGKDKVLNARTAGVLNKLYTAIGGEQDGFFPQDLQEHKIRLVKEQIQIHKYGHH